MTTSILCLLLFFLSSPYIVISEIAHTSFYSKLDNVVYGYLNEIKNEKELSLCRPDSVCSVVNRRFWFPSKVYRVCRCAKSQCPFEWKNDNYSVPLDNRSQLKTCENTNYMESCNDKNVGLTVTEMKQEKTWMKDISLKCRCDWPSYWRLSGSDMNRIQIIREYTCSKLYRCQPSDFCGHVRSDTHSVYYQCSCPKGHLCINKDRTMRNATELLYHGPTYRAYCIPQLQVKNSTKPV